ncbi:MAG: hypothetical protein HW373_1401 [Deltaproteobacteria bacterium]|nr:hypothetical protein [Deltaproteobacteria bacterium]
MQKRWKRQLARRFPRIAASIRNFFRRLGGKPLVSASGELLIPRGRLELPAQMRADPPLTREFLAGLELCVLDDPVVSIVIVSYERPDFVENLIKSIWLHSDGFRYEVIVVENGSAPGKHELSPEIAMRVHVIALADRTYLGEAYNIGARQAKGRYLVLLNNDVVVRPRWLSALIGEFERDAAIGAAGPKLLFPTGELQEAGAFIDRAGYPIRRGRGKNAGEPAFNRKEEVDYCSGAALAMRRELFLQLSGYEQHWDLCFKVRALGHKVVYVPSSEVVHLENATMAESPPAPDMTVVIEANRKRFVRTWKDALDRPRSRA